MSSNRQPIPKHVWKALYRYVAEVNGDIGFMNYGFAGGAALDLDAHDEVERYGMQLYDCVAGDVSLEGANLVEVGSGRGGGARFLMRYRNGAGYVGIDFSPSNVVLSRRRFLGLPSIRFAVGDAEQLPLRAASADAVINVESSHCYADRSRFFDEARRILRPGGRFLFADFFAHDVRPEPLFETAGFRVERCDEITSGVVSALNADSERRRTIAAAAEPHRQALLASWAGVEGLPIYESFRSGAIRYWALGARIVG
jgi:ubiquinone/menaquinone biosynthesis C-methylase UbiE